MRDEDEILNNPDTITVLHEEDITDQLEKTLTVLKKEKTFLELHADEAVTFVGDTHGDFETTKSIVKNFFDKSILVFLGDYIDREPMEWGSLYNITYLLTLKYHHPEKIFLLKGNHECNYAIPCFPYEFKNEIIRRFGSPFLHEKFVEIFSSMPLMILVKNVIAAHGGIPKEAGLNELRKMGKNDVSAISAIAWSDPVISPVYRGIGDRFNEKELHQFLENVNAHMFIRGHDYHLLGISIYNDRCLTIFSCSRYKKMGNRGILVAKAENKISVASDLILKDFSTGKWLDYTAKKLSGGYKTPVR